MMTSKAWIIGMAAAAIFSSTSARAQEPEGDREPAPLRGRPAPGDVAAPRKALEIAVDAGFTQPTGALSAGHRIDDVVGPGIGLGLALGYRATPRWSTELSAHYHASESRASTGAGGPQGAATLVGVTCHLLPYELVDPYVSLATGYRFLVERPAGGSASAITQGLDVVRVQLGMDLRSTKDVGLSLYAAADVDVFLWSQAGSSFGATLGGGRPSAFLSGGMQGRFDIGGSRVVPRRALIAEQ